jgi:predicted  nucleic acid-binding Zn-ribbon protein
MRVRHRIPSIFNLSMVDVLCCALGCVILLWLINLREAKFHEESAEEEHLRITTELAGLRADRDNVLGMVTQLESRIAALREERSALQKSLKVKQTEAADLAQRLEKSSQRIVSLENDLSERMKSQEMETTRAEDLDRKLKGAAGRVAALEKDLRQSEKRGEKETARSGELAEALAAARMRLKELQTTANLVPSLREDLKEARELYATEKAMAAALEKEVAKRRGDLKDADKNLEKLTTSRRSLEHDLEAREKELTRLREQNKSLQGETARVRAAAENRFAGITLTGRRVLFLVDTSGSMDLVDENTKAPTKWTDVGNTVARLMRSLPDLENYQVIVFAEKTSFLFAGEEDWLDYKAQSSPERVRTALAKIAPTGGTNMYAALQLAFRLRAKGMDTIYLFSDGLPNLGEGIRPEEINSIREVERNDRLARYIRQTLQSNWNRALPGQPRVRINTIGFFYESPDVGAFLWALARENDGSFVGMSKP